MGQGGRRWRRGERLGSWQAASVGMDKFKVLETITEPQPELVTSPPLLSLLSRSYRVGPEKREEGESTDRNYN